MVLHAPPEARRSGSHPIGTPRRTNRSAAFRMGFIPGHSEQCMRICKVGLLRIAAASLILVVAYSALLCVPEPFFSFSVRADNLILHSDQPFSGAECLRCAS